ncbi:phosphohistidine phosphatase [Streptosporangium becharense]|uniref:Phosphohistidine phosphatase n=1 Tax=Streptosporangium becharense TaxID=1816182 RepID=A0A7W9IM40_9ACTN|nr:histidine phosphatase family protein [Streptosporangium becharense]MBB2910368.1 phosphohistidine phosphatase [Streptosporangium becharense]MBB5823111.1 phosphohistidine phosphatase [Streptosporangium becharense]
MTENASRKLIVVRHAKSAWPAGVDDFDRPLAPRGRRDAPAVGRWLRGAGPPPDRVVSSPALRTRETWELVAGELGTEVPVSYDERVYEASVPGLLGIVHEVPDGVRTLLLLGHNPGLEELVTALAGEAAGDALERVREKFPTSAIAVLAVPGPWSGLAPGTAVLTDFAVPRGVKTAKSHKS